ncbi:MAG: hypothetical protein ABW360_15335 [Phenylobacterium sp.]
MKPILAALILAAVASPALASSPDAWAAFRKDVGDRCLAAAKAQGMKAPQVIIHPLGTDTHGIAVLLEGSDKRICVYDKHTKAVELTPAT